MDSVLKAKWIAALRAKPDRPAQWVFGMQHMSYQTLADNLEKATEIGERHCQLLEAVAEKLNKSLEELILKF